MVSIHSACGAASVSNRARSLTGSRSVAETNRVERSRFIAVARVSKPVADHPALVSSQGGEN